jgi:predicted dehydrogenase
MTLGVGVIGCGQISEVYLRTIPSFRDLRLVACASRRIEQAEEKAAAHGIAAMPVEALLGRSDVDIVLNLTPPDSHVAVTMAALAAGKHVYSEKPVAPTLADIATLKQSAASASRSIAAAPDTCLGPTIQLAARLVREDAIGRPLFGVAAFLAPGPEWQHPSPGFFYRKGGGPALDMAPYYLAALVTMLGPVATVTARSVDGEGPRMIRAPSSPRFGETLDVEVATTTQALLAFECGATVSFIVSWDVHRHGLPHIEIFGSEETLRLPNPDWFGGDLLLARGAGAFESLPADDLPFGAPNRQSRRGPVADYRGLGVAEFANALLTGRPHRLDLDFAGHVIAIVEALEASSRSHMPEPVLLRTNAPAALSGSEAARLLRPAG